MTPRRPLSELVRRPEPPRRQNRPADPEPDTSRVRLDEANERLAKARRDFALWKEETDQRINSWRQQRETDHRQWMTQMNTRLANLQQGRQSNE